MIEKPQWPFSNDPHSPAPDPNTELLEKKDPFFIPEYVGGRFAPESWASREERCVFVFHAGLLL